jgi:arylsulfatase
VQPSRRDSASAPDFGLRRVQVLAFAILVLGLDVAVLGACSSGDEEPAAAAEGRGSLRAEHFFLLTADTWRADFLGREIAGTPLTPQLDAFVAARGGIVFEDNTSVAAMTSPGVAGILSGLMPLRSGVMENVHVLPTTVPTLSELLGAHGFRTAAFVANPVLRPGYGFERGFETYELLPAEPPDRKARGAAVVARALRWLDERGPAERLFLWLHFMEPHGPYEPPPDLLDALPLTDFGVSPIPVARLVVGDQVGRGGVPHYQWNSDAHPGGDDGREYVRRYAAEVMALDRVLGSFLAALETRGLLETSLTVVASDHGEALLGDHGFFFSHANYATEDQLRTPLVIVHPGGRGGKRRTPTSNLDIAPTARALLGLPPDPENQDGIDLLEPVADRFVLAQFRDQRMLRRGAIKLRIDEPGGKQQLFDLSVDPDERLPLAPASPELLREFRDEMERHQHLPRKGRPIDRFRMSDEERRELEALGYVQ